MSLAKLQSKGQPRLRRAANLFVALRYQPDAL